MAALYVDGLAEIPSVAPRLPSPEAPYIYIYSTIYGIRSLKP